MPHGRSATARPPRQGTAATHGAPLGEEEIAGARDALGWRPTPFEVPEAEVISDVARPRGSRGDEIFKAWKSRFAAQPAKVQADFERIIAGDLPADFAKTIDDSEEKDRQADQPKQATRQSSGAVLEALTGVIPELVGGSADLTGSEQHQG